MNLELLLRHYRDHVRRPRAQASRERERFVHELSIVFATGETGTLE